MDKETEYILTGKLKTGDYNAFKALYYMYSGQLYNFALSMVYDSCLAKDIVQETFLTVWENRENVKHDKNFSAYLFTIVRHNIYRELKQKMKNIQITEENMPEEPTSIHETIIDELTEGQLKHILNYFVGDLPTSRKKIFLLKRDTAMTNKEIATLLNISEKTVETQLYRAIKYLKSRMEKIID